MTHTPRVTKALLRWISILVGALLAAGTVVALLAGHGDTSATLAVCLLAFVAGYILGS